MGYSVYDDYVEITAIQKHFEEADEEDIYYETTYITKLYRNGTIEEDSISTRLDD